MLAIERDTPGLERGRNLEKVGQHSQDTAELFFNDARGPVENLLDAEGQGFSQMVHNLAQERLSVAVVGVATAHAAIRMTVEYVKEREAFGSPVFGVPEHALRARGLQGGGRRDDAARRRHAVGRARRRGGYGYMLEYPIARLYADARVSRIYDGSNEIMKEIVGRRRFA